MVTELQQPYDFIYTREHVTHGYVYFFGGLEVTVPGTIALCDSNKDGALDYPLVMSGTAAWESQGFSDESKYRD